MRTQFIAVILLAFCVGAVAQEPKKDSPPAGTEISADLGPCSAEFHVTDLRDKGLFNAKISTQIRYGFLAKRKLDLEVATDAGGNARFTKLPAQLKKSPLTFTVTYGEETASLSYDPGTNCNATYHVPLGKKTEEKK